jgi:hypothetical protein
MLSEELYVYTDKIKNPSETFKIFLHDYVTGNIWIRSRGDEDISVWDNLKGDELAIAKQIILDELKMIPDESYMRAVSIFKDERAIPILMSLIDTLPHLDLKLLAAKALYDFTGYKDYVPMLEAACKNHNDDLMHNYLKYSISQFISGLKKKDKIRILIALGEPFLGRV